jgi:3-deoxy-manno-octulosonate cytidylyltransferase (CMP-KDO synthetase)
MIEHVFRRAAAARSVSSVIVATDDERVAAAVAAFGGAARMTSAAHPSGTDRLAEVARSLECDLVVNVQGDEPLIEPDMIDQAVAAFVGEPDLVMSTLCCRITDAAEYSDPSVVKVVVDQEGYALYFSRAPIPHHRHVLPAGDLSSGATTGRESLSVSREPSGQDFRPFVGPSAVAYKHVGLYVYRREFLLRLAALEPTPLERAEGLEQLRPLEQGFRIRTLVTAFEPIGVDTPEDLERVRRIAATKLRLEPTTGPDRSPSFVTRAYTHG